MNNFSKNQKHYNNPLNGKYYIFKAGWEFQKDNILKSGENKYLDYVYLYNTWDEYTLNMRVHIWDFVIRYCHKFLRLNEDELAQLSEYLIVVRKNT